MLSDNRPWAVIRTIPRHRVEFAVVRQVGELGYETMLPFETVYERRPGKRRADRKYALFPCYVFVCMEDAAADYNRLRQEIPEIKGILSRSRTVWSPFILPVKDVELVRRATQQCLGATETDIHKALRIGKAVEVSVGGSPQRTKIDAVTKKGVKVLLRMFDGMHVVEVPFGQVRAA